MLKKLFPIFSLALFSPLTALAQGLKNAGDNLGSMNVGLSADFEGSLSSYLNGAYYVLGTVFFGLMIYGGFVWLKAAGRESEVDRAKKIIIAAVAGMALLFFAYAITNFILVRVG